MGGVCIKGTTVRDSPYGSLSSENASGKRASAIGGSQKYGFSSKNLGDDDDLMKMGNMERQIHGSLSFSDGDIMPLYKRNRHQFDSGELRVSKSGKLTPAMTSRTAGNKVSEVGSLLGRAGTAGLGKAVEVLDTLGSSMTNLNPSSGFVSGLTSKGNIISIRAFEVANTIAKGANLFQSLSEENIKVLKEEVLHSDGVQRLVSTDMDELLGIAAADKRWPVRE